MWWTRIICERGHLARLVPGAHTGTDRAARDSGRASLQEADPWQEADP
jgi:hypothetical protein